jgi:hypothetical protein
MRQNFPLYWHDKLCKVSDMKLICLSYLGLMLFANLALCQQENVDEPETSAPSTPEDLLDNEHVREELAVNDFTAPSIAKVFTSLQHLSPLPMTDVERKFTERMPLDRADLAIEIGFLIADGFLIVESGDMTKVEDLAKELSRYGKALGAGDRVSRHVASLLESAKNNKPDQLKIELTATQKDVEKELVTLRDTDLAHLISLGGWLRALNVAATAVDKQFSPERGKELMREDIADYYTETLGTLHPRISERPNFVEMREILSGLRNDMLVDKKNPITAEKVAQILAKSKELVRLAAKRVAE